MQRNAVPSWPRRWRRLPAALGLLVAAGLFVVGTSAAAFAHVTVHPDTAAPGGYAALTFRVPNETDDADTTKLQVFFPAAHPLASVSVRPHAGWSYRVETTKLPTPAKTAHGTIDRAVSEITWTADSARTAIKPGEFDEFEVSAGPLPEHGQMVFKALQTYSDGQVVRWIQQRVAGQPEPAHPAPVLTLLPPAGATGTTAAAAGGSGTATAALALSIAALVVALGGAGLAVLRRSRS